jgi:hypothetical protein
LTGHDPPSPQLKLRGGKQQPLMHRKPLMMHEHRTFCSRKIERRTTKENWFCELKLARWFRRQRDPFICEISLREMNSGKVRDCDGPSNFPNLFPARRAIHQYGWTQDETSPTQTSRAIPTFSRGRKYSEWGQQDRGPQWGTKIHEYPGGATFRRNAQRCPLSAHRPRNCTSNREL